ncbi:unnamed protein product [Dracunculus medinensis]|uniref:Uncharacterized protein n=1 Tax=Dracunculus medinensis TaxID=318479 RepID=A0A0N4U6X8_DRAME|nr:unnamed protein product [Dracunculus medinensis]
MLRLGLFDDKKATGIVPPNQSSYIKFMKHSGWKKRSTSTLTEKQWLNALTDKKNEAILLAGNGSILHYTQTQNVQKEEEKRDAHATSWEAGNCLLTSLM